MTLGARSSRDVLIQSDVLNNAVGFATPAGRAGWYDDAGLWGVGTRGYQREASASI